MIPGRQIDDGAGGRGSNGYDDEERLPTEASLSAEEHDHPAAGLFLIGLVLPRDPQNVDGIGDRTALDGSHVPWEVRPLAATRPDLRARLRS